MKLVTILLAAAGIPLFSAQTLTQPAQQVPEASDRALRERITFFYQAHVDGKFRLADTVVHEDSKDAFFAMEKRRYRSFEIVKIAYTDNFTRARAVVAVETDLLMPGVGAGTFKMPVTSSWRLDNGEWFWYVEPRKDAVTPFGAMKPGPGGGGPSPVIAALEKMPDPETILRLVKLDKSEIRFQADRAGSDSVTVANEMPGPVSLTVEGPSVVGLVVELDRRQLKSGEQAQVSFRYTPGGGAPPAEAVTRITVEPTGRVFEVRVVFARAD